MIRESRKDMIREEVTLLQYFKEYQPPALLFINIKHCNTPLPFISML
jgi:hypothetical protein